MEVVQLKHTHQEGNNYAEIVIKAENCCIVLSSFANAWRVSYYLVLKLVLIKFPFAHGQAYYMLINMRVKYVA